MKKKILIGATNFSAYCGRAKALLLENGFEIVENQFGRPFTRDELAGLAGDVCGALVGCEEWTEEIFATAPQVKVLVRFGIGVDNIDLAAAKAHGVKVCNAKGINSDAVAEYTVGAILAVYRNLINLDRTTREGGWDRFVGRTLRGKTVGLVGFGAIAQYAAKLLGAFDPAKIYAYDVVEDREAAGRLGVVFTGMETILREADIITLHVPVVPETFHLFGDREFGMMKDTAILVNVARGPVVDEGALYRALKEKQIAGAGIDVYESEPTTKENPLFALDNVVVTPHTAAETFEVYDNISLFGARTVLEVLDGRNPQNWLNP